MARYYFGAVKVRFLLGLILVASLISLHASAADIRKCRSVAAQASLEVGMKEQGELESESALDAYKKCLQIEPGCLACRYEIGWSYWKLGKWEDVVATWEGVLKDQPSHPDIPQYLLTAKENLALLKQKKLPDSFISGVALGTHSEPAEAPVSMLLLARRQSYNPSPAHPMDQYDLDIHSPKSVGFSNDGKKVYVNSLEGGRTVIYDALGIEKKGVISHKFKTEDQGLFSNKVPWGYHFPKNLKTPNEFIGKPVEMEFSRDGKFLFIPYYRRSYDEKGTMPSALAVVDTSTDQINRVMAVGPIAKYVKRSHKGKILAISHWGDNTVGLMDISSQKPENFHPTQLLVVEKRMDLKKNLSLDRDKDCGFCVRGLAFSQDDRYLFVTRMKGGGIAVFRLHGNAKPDYLGTVFGLVPGPRDLEISQKGEIYISCNASGVVARLPWKNIVAALEKETMQLPYEKRRLIVKPADLGMEKVYVGVGARSIRLSHDEANIFVSVNQTSELITVDTKTMKVAARIPVDSYPVGLDLSPDDRQLWVTSQGRSAKGGNSVGIFQVRYKTHEIIPLKSGSP
jgi:hypothetical protein